MKCPVCVETDLVMSERQNVEIDYCPKCRGVWLDRGELDKIIERSAAETAPAATSRAPEYDLRRDDGHASRGGHHGKGSKRRSWLHEIFD